MEINLKYYYELLSIYSNLSQKMKDKIFFAILRNEFRIFDEKDSFEKKIRKIIDSCRLEDNNCILKSELRELFQKKGYTYKCKVFNYNNYIDIILNEINIICHNLDNKKIRGVAMALFLDINSLLPLISYAFDKPLFAEQLKKEKLIHIIELSISYLYRMIEININTNDLGKEIGIGAYCKVLLSNNKLYKVPLNFAAFFYANIKEWDMYIKLSDTKLVKYIPQYFSYHSKSGIIEKEYIFGRTGEQILIQRGCLSETEKKCLKDIYNIITEVCKKRNVLLDIHPNNFVWNMTRKQWYLVDLGENQYIGSDYYIIDNFEKYYKKSWLEREMRKRKYPIRSVLI